MQGGPEALQVGLNMFRLGAGRHIACVVYRVQRTRPVRIECGCNAIEIILLPADVRRQLESLASRGIRAQAP